MMIGVVQEMSHPVFAENNSSSSSPGSKMSTKGQSVRGGSDYYIKYSQTMIIWPNELALQTFKTFLAIISSMSLIHICGTFRIDYGYLCLYVFS
jgi:hypothetical protein